MKRLAGSCWVITILSFQCSTAELEPPAAVCVFSVRAVAYFVGKRGSMRGGLTSHVFVMWEDTCQHVYAGYIHVHVKINTIAGVVKNEKSGVNDKRTNLHTSTSKIFHMQSSKVND